MEQQFSNIEECNDYIEFLNIKCKPIPKWVMTEKERIEREDAIPDTEYIFGTMAAHNPFMTEEKKKTGILATKDGWIVDGKKYPKEQPPQEVAQELAKVIQALLKKDLH